MAGLNYGNRYTLAGQGIKSTGCPAKKKPVYLFNRSGILIATYAYIKDAAKENNISESSVRVYIKNRTLHKGKYFSFDKELKPANLF